MMDSLLRNGYKVTKTPSTLALRGHLSNRDEYKSRSIVMYPYEIQILEAKYFKPLYKRLKQVSPILSGKQSLQKLHRYLNKYPDYAYINTDISGWDSMRSIFLIQDAFKMLVSYLDIDKEDLKAIKWLKDYLINTPIMLPSGDLIRKKGGIPSGTFLTLLINTACNYIAQHTILSYLNVPFYDLQILGDDCAFYISDHSFFDRYFSKICKLNLVLFNLKMNEDKSISTVELSKRKFIGYQFSGLELVRERDEFFRSALYPESDVKNVAISFSRMFAYLCIGGINDRRFFDFFSFFCTCYQDSLRMYKRSVFKEKVFRFGSLRIFKDILDFDVGEIINLDFDGFLNLDFYAIRWMFSLNVSIKVDFNKTV